MVLIGYWPLNETSGTTAQDHSGKENHGSITGAGPAGTGTVSGPTGTTAYKFDGSDDYIDTGKNFTSSQPNSISISGWVKLHDLSQRRIIAASNDGTNQMILTDHPDGLGFFTYDNGSATLYGIQRIGTSLTLNEWNHITGTYSSSYGYKLYLNGTELSSSSDTSFFTDSDTLKIGRNGSKNSGYWDGSISEVRIYNHALTPQEIQYLYTVGKQGRMVTNKKNI